MRVQDDNWEPQYGGANVLVTGGAGFIGSHLVDRLAAAGARVTVFDNLSTGRWDNLGTCPDEDLQRVMGDTRDDDAVGEVIALAQPQYVFHLAANASVPDSVEDPKMDFECNCTGTFVVLNELRKRTSGARFLLASSGTVYGEPQTFPIVETDALSPISPYGGSKLGAEVLARTFCRVYGVPTVVARLFNAYGPRMTRFVVLDFLRKLQADPRRLEILGNGTQTRDFTYVSDTVEGLLMLGARGAAGGAYNLSSGSCCTVTDLAATLLEVLGLKQSTILAYTGESWAGDAQRWEVSIGRIRSLGYAPRVSLRQGLELTAAWYVKTFGAIG